jgi:hypothetical protein
VDHTREASDAAGSGVGMKNTLATSLLDRASSSTQMRLSRRISTVSCGHDLFHEGLDPRLDRLIAGVPFQVLFVSFLF